MMYYARTMETPLCRLTICSDGTSIVGVWMEGQKYFASTLKETPSEEARPELEQAADWLNRYFRGERPRIDELKLDPAGSPFRKKIWQILCSIPYGRTMTYGEIAEAAGCRSAQAVGGAVGHNPISIISPCHRVVGSDGSLTGYAGGIRLKTALLEHEGADMSQFYVPEKGTAL